MRGGGGTFVRWSGISQNVKHTPNTTDCLSVQLSMFCTRRSKVKYTHKQKLLLVVPEFITVIRTTSIRRVAGPVVSS